MKPRRGEAAPLVALFLLTVFLFWPALFAGRVFWYRDVGGYWIAQAESFVRVVRSGAPPLWNPYASFGLPMLADPSNQVAYPVTWLNLLLRPGLFFTMYVVLHTLVAALGQYALARSLALERAPSGLAAAVWICSGPFLSLSSHAHHFAGAAFMPMVLFGLERALSRRTPGSAVLLGAVAALQLLAGSADMCLMTAFAALGHLAIRPGARPKLADAIGVLASALFFALSLSAIQWLPTLGILAFGVRPAMSETARLVWSLHPASLADLFVPRLLSDLPWRDGARATLFDGREPFLASVYLGAAAVPLVVAGLVGAWSRARAYATAGFALALLAALGRYTPLYGVLAATTPLGLLRYPAKFMIPAALFWSLLVGLAACDWLREPSRRQRVAALGAAALLSLACLAGAGLGAASPLVPWLERDSQADVAAATLKLASAGTLVACMALLLWLSRGSRTPRSAALAALVALVAGDVASAGRDSVPLAPAELLRARPRAADLLPAEARIYFSAQGRFEDLARSVVREPVGWRPAWANALGNVDLLRPPSGARWGLRGSYDGDFTGLAPALLSNLTLIVQHATGTWLGERLLRLGGVEYVIGSGTAWPGLEPVAEIQSVFAAPIPLWRVPATQANAFVVTGARRALEPEAVELLASPDFDPAREVILASGASREPSPAKSALKVLERRADREAYAVETDAPAWLVVLETFHPGWRATLDGNPTEVLRADVLFRAVALPPGRHLVTLSYRPTTVYAGLATTGAGLLAALATLAIASRSVEPAA